MKESNSEMQPLDQSRQTFPLPPEINENPSLLLQTCSVLSYTVLFNTIIYKFPQMYNIVSSGSSLGVSLRSVVMEWVAYSIMLTYQFAMDYPLETYFENTIMVFEDFLLTGVVLHNRKMISVRILPYAALYFVGFLSIAMNWLPAALMFMAIASTTFMLCWSKLDQLLLIWMTKNPGSLSTLTWFIVVYDTAVRILTTVVITKDIPMFMNLAMSEVLNVSIFLSIIYYNRLKANRRASRQRSSRRDGH